jgi:hypothetical protein
VTDEDDVSEASGIEDSSEEDPSAESGLEEATSDEDTKPTKSTPGGRSVKKSLPLHRKQADEKELWRPGAKLAPGTQLIIKKPKAREAGDTPYTDESIHPNTMLFLQDLAQNNDRQWLKCMSMMWTCKLSCATFSEAGTAWHTTADIALIRFRDHN